MTIYRPMTPRPKPDPRPKKKPQGIKKSTGAKMDNFNKALFVATRGPLCQCGCGEHVRDNVMDAHHCLFPRSKNFPQLNDWENLVLVTHYEHIIERKFNTLEWRQRFFVILCEIYTKEHMLRWLVSLPSKLHSRIDFLDPSDKALFNAAVMNG